MAAAMAIADMKEMMAGLMEILILMETGEPVVVMVAVTGPDMAQGKVREMVVMDLVYQEERSFLLLHYQKTQKKKVRW